MHGAGTWIRAARVLMSSPTARKSVISLVDQVVVSATNFLTGVIIGRACIKEEFGLYMLGLSIVIFVSGIQSSLIWVPYMVYSPRLQGYAHTRYTGSLLIHQLALSALVVVALTVAAVIFSLGIGPQGLAPVVWALVVVITFIMLRYYIRQVSFAGLRMKTAFLFDSCVAVIQIGGLIILAYIGLLSAARAYGAVGIACGVAALCWLISHRKAFDLRVEHAISDFRHNWSFGKWVFAGSLAWALSMNLYPWILAALHGTAATGVWAACFGIAAIGNPLYSAGQNFLGPKIAHSYAEGSTTKSHKFVFKAATVFSLLITPLCVTLLLFGGHLVVWLYGDKYAGNGLIVSILAVNLLVSAGAFCFSRALFAMERSDVDFLVNFVALFVFLTVGLWLIKFFGPLGVACGLLVGNSLATAVRCVAFTVLARSTGRRQAR